VFYAPKELWEDSRGPPIVVYVDQSLPTGRSAHEVDRVLCPGMPDELRTRSGYLELGVKVVSHDLRRVCGIFVHRLWCWILIPKGETWRVV
jgi:hypothetical protein